MGGPIVIGLCGGSASGKTKFLEDIKVFFSAKELCVIGQDNYYKPKHLQQADANGVLNFDLPESIDVERFHEDVLKLVNGNIVEIEEYTFNNPAITPKKIILKPAPIIIIEGIFVFHYTDIWNLLDTKVFIHSKKAIKNQRRLNRDIQERGYEENHINYTGKYHVDPAYKKYIKPFRHEADIVIPNNEKGYRKAMEILVGYLKFKLMS